jgi:hypothetical protein
LPGNLGLVLHDANCVVKLGDDSSELECFCYDLFRKQERTHAQVVAAQEQLGATRQALNDHVEVHRVALKKSNAARKALQVRLEQWMGDMFRIPG